MKAVKLFQKIGFVLIGGLVFSHNAAAQKTSSPKTSDKIVQTAEAKDDVIETGKPKAKSTPRPDKTKPEKGNAAAPPQIPTESKEEAEVVSYYSNYLNDYRLGAQDVISVEVFGQCPDYCKTNITVPPTARISYPLIREGIFVGGKTTLQVQDEITKRLDEYIIDPKVNVTLDKAGSARYSVLGKVVAPGIKIMDRKVSLYEAVVESGGVLKEGDKKKVVLISFGAEGKLVRQEVNLQEIERGKAKMIYLNPGDQVYVPSKGFQFNVETVFKVLDRINLARFMLGGL